MKYIFALVILAVAVAALPRMKRQTAYFLPDGVELVVGPVQTSFKCEGLSLGFYADQANDCKVFHVCNPVTHPDGTVEVQHYSFFCGNQTVFNQLTLTCAHPDEAVDCARAKDFFYVNKNIGIENEDFLREEDVAKAYKA